MLAALDGADQLGRTADIAGARVAELLDDAPGGGIAYLLKIRVAAAREVWILSRPRPR